MRRFFFKPQNLIDNEITLDDEEFFHLKNVLRLNEGEKIVCFCGDGYDYFCYLKQVLKNSALCAVEQIKKSDKTANVNVTLFQGSLKLDKLELVIQKMAEIGLAAVIPFESAFSVAKIKAEKTNRLAKIALEASKQCGRADILKVSDVVSFNQMIKMLNDYDVVIFANERESQNQLKSLQLNSFKKIAFIVGSEGGFSEKEATLLIEKGAKSITLGKRILRAETAPIVLGGIIMFLQNEI